MNKETNSFIVPIPEQQSWRFLSKIFSYTVISSFLQKLSTLTIAKLTNSTKTDITLQRSLKWLRSFTMCNTFTPDCR